MPEVYHIWSVCQVYYYQNFWRQWFNGFDCELGQIGSTFYEVHSLHLTPRFYVLDTQFFELTELNCMLRSRLLGQL